MRFFLSVLGCGLVWAGSCLAQVKVAVALDQEQYMPNESLVAIVRVTNLSGQKLQLGKDAGWLKFFIEAQDGEVVAKMAEVPVRGEFLLESSQVATKRVDLVPYYDLSIARRYRVSAVVKVAQWDQEFASEPKEFDIIHGTKFWEQEFGVPNSAAGANGRPEMRKYIVSEATYLKRLRLYVRVTDPTETRVFRVLPISSMVSFSRPEVQVDRLSNLHVLHQTGARAFSYCVVNPDGDVITRETHEYTNTRPTLRVGQDGKISVSGGERRVTQADIPPPNASRPAGNVNPAKP
ncbi:MAG: hypothetical protein ACYDH9_20120 [Limisphaerales bacterium]